MQFSSKHLPIENENMVILGNGLLTIEDIVQVARNNRKVAEIGSILHEQSANGSLDRLLQTRAWVEDAVAKNEALQRNGENAHSYYGINTGFGSKAGREPLRTEDIPWVSYNLIISHATGVGIALAPEIVRAAMLIRANSLAQGYSGVRPILINTLIRMLNNNVCPVVPQYGSVGASGDLAPLSHLAQVMALRPSEQEGSLKTTNIDYDESGEAFVLLEAGEEAYYPVHLTIYQDDQTFNYTKLTGHAALRLRGIEPLLFQAKEGLAFNNGATFSAAIGALALYDAENIAYHSELATALCLEAMLGFRDAFLPHVHIVRHHKGQQAVAARIIDHTRGSTLLTGDHDVNPHKLRVPPQDPYSLRVAPQVIGAVWDSLAFIRTTITAEINAATDNPLIFLSDQAPVLLRDYRSVSGGNFHGAPIAYAMDLLSIVMTDLGSLSERRSFRLTDPNLNRGLPAMLIADDPKKPGRTSGLMIAQYLAASLVSECKTLAHPDSVDSIPTSANQEDHVSMSMNAALHARTVVQNVEYITAIELLCGFIALETRLADLTQQMQFIDPSSSNLDISNPIVATVARLKEAALMPQCGQMCEKALRIIGDSLYKSDKPLPLLGREPTSVDRYLRPYVLRLFDLIRSKQLMLGE